MRHLTFRAIFEGLILSDRLVSSRGLLTMPQPLWPPLLVAVAQGCARGEPITRETFGRGFLQVYQESLSGCLLSALPVLLLNVDRYGHRQAYLGQWATDLGLPEGAIAGLADLFIHLCQAHARGSLPALTSPPWNREPQPGPDSRDRPLGAAHQLVQQVQGQFWLGVQLAHRQGWTTSQVGLVALLTTIRGGLTAIPWGLGQEQNGSLQETVSSGWSLAERQQLRQAATALYYQWIGLQEGPEPLAVENIIAVTI